VEISRLDFVGVPSRDGERTRKFYVETLGLRPAKARSDLEVKVGGNDLMLHNRYAPHAG
jgi:catechol 2,3-dioxygenase-like lactoylglutathione lyase family enzyme